MDEIKRYNLSELKELCREQTELYVRHEPYVPHYCFEIWRRAIVERDEAAWEASVNQYSIFVRRWLNQRLSHLPALRFEEEVLVNGVFFNFYRFVGPEKFGTFHNLAGILQYLKMCCGTIVADAQRDFQARSLDTSLDLASASDEGGEAGPSQADRLSDPLNIEERVLDQADRARFWKEVWRKLPDEQDRILVYLRYIHDIPPREIVQLYPQYFSDVTQIYRRIKNLLWRLRNSPEF